MKPELWQFLDTAETRRKIPDYSDKSFWRPLYTHPMRDLTDEEIEVLDKALKRSSKFIAEGQLKKASEK
jgi:hypothetical protein